MWKVFVLLKFLLYIKSELKKHFGMRQLKLIRVRGGGGHERGGGLGHKGGWGRVIRAAVSEAGPGRGAGAASCRQSGVEASSNFRY